MNRYVLLENIANGIHAANRIRHLQKSTYSSSRSEAPIDRVAVISEIIQSIAQYSPGGYRSSLSDAGSRCCEYCNTYKNFKYHLQSSRSHGVRKDRFINSLKILEPVVDSRKKAAIEKILKIYELFISNKFVGHFSYCIGLSAPGSVQ